jgi:hypothetical protein
MSTKTSGDPAAPISIGNLLSGVPGAPPTTGQLAPPAIGAEELTAQRETSKDDLVRTLRAAMNGTNGYLLAMAPTAYHTLKANTVDPIRNQEGGQLAWNAPLWRTNQTIEQLQRGVRRLGNVPAQLRGRMEVVSESAEKVAIYEAINAFTLLCTTLDNLCPNLEAIIPPTTTTAAASAAAPTAPDSSAIAAVIELYTNEIMTRKCLSTTTKSLPALTVLIKAYNKGTKCTMKLNKRLPPDHPIVSLVSYITRQLANYVPSTSDPNYSQGAIAAVLAGTATLLDILSLERGRASAELEAESGITEMVIKEGKIQAAVAKSTVSVEASTVPEIIRAVNVTAMVLEFVDPTMARALREFALIAKKWSVSRIVKPAVLRDIVRAQLAYLRHVILRRVAGHPMRMVDFNLLQPATEAIVAAQQTSAAKLATGACLAFKNAMYLATPAQATSEKQQSSKDKGRANKPSFASLTTAQRAVQPCPEIPSLNMCMRHLCGPKGKKLCHNGCDKAVKTDGDAPNGKKYHYCIRGGAHAVHKVL